MPIYPTQALLGGLLIVVAMMTVVWLWSLPTRDASLVDRFWGLAFVVLAWWYVGTSGTAAPDPPQALMLGAVTLWGLRLTGYIWWRNRGKGEDRRYTEMRRRRGAAFPLVSLVTVFWLQALLAWVIAMPLFAGLRSARPPNALILALGVICWLVGMVFEIVADWQLARHRADPKRRGTVLDTGLWRYTRHPNYFGDAMVWWGFWLIAASLGGAWTVFSPTLMTFLLVRVSGVALLEQDLSGSKPGYAEYVARTSAIIPRRPGPPRSPGPDRNRSSDRP